MLLFIGVSGAHPANCFEINVWQIRTDLLFALGALGPLDEVERARRLLLDSHRSLALSVGFLAI